VRKAQERGVYFEERVVWKYFAQICAGMAHMHARRVMHRDLKPANIFLTLEGQIKVGDLGLGRALSEDTMEAHSKVRVMLTTVIHLNCAAVYMYTVLLLFMLFRLLWCAFYHVTSAESAT
jgi:serine/threonine protein kinase